MEKLTDHLQYNFEPIAWYDEDTQTYKPSVRVTLNGAFVEWRVYELGFDEPRFVIPYARELAKETAAIFQRMVDNTLTR